MSLNFQNPMNEQTESLIREIFKDKIKAMDERTVLMERFNEIKQSDMKEIANTANQPVEVELHGKGDIKTMSDGTKYEVTDQGWRKV